MKLRPYQHDAVEAVLEAFGQAQSALVVMPTGLGKTQVFCEVAQRMAASGRVMVLAHREELIWQAAKRYEHMTGRQVDIEMAELEARRSIFDRTDVIVSSVQTQIAGRGRERFWKFDPADFALLIVDECFPAGTLVDGRPIEIVRVGDSVRCFDHATSQVVRQKVTQTFRRIASRLVIVRLANGREIICTSNHPFYTLRGYVPAGILSCSDVVLTINHTEGHGNEDADMCDLRDEVHAGTSQSEHHPLLQTGMRIGRNQTQTEDSYSPVPDLRKESRIERKKWAGSGVQGDGRMFARMPAAIEFADHGGHEPALCVGKNVEAQPHETGVGSREGVHVVAYDGVAPAGARGQRRIDGAADASGVCTRLANGSGHTDAPISHLGISHRLQGGHCERGVEDRHRGGRTESLLSGKTGRGYEEGCSLTFARVDRVEIYKPAGASELRGLHGGCEVFNLEVETHHNYFANGVLVHNCHHAPAASWRRVISYYRKNSELKILGVTATPDRHDEEALGQIFETVAYDYELPQAIVEGWLVPIEQRAVHVEGLDYSTIRTTAGDLNGADLARVMEYEDNLHRIASPTIELIEDRKTLVFAASVAHAERLCEIFNRHKADSARWVCGTTPKEERRRLVSDYAAGRFQVLCNVGIATEGFDDPSIEVVVMARPTKSRSLYAQMAGRGTRPLPGLVDGCETADERCLAIAMSAKPRLEIVDFVGNSGRHKLVSSADILGGNHSDKAVERAKKAAEEAGEEGRQVDMLDELDKAERELREEEERERRRKLRVAAIYSTSTVSPFDVLQVRPWKERGWDKGRAPSEKMTAFLERQGIATQGLTFGQARQLIQEIIGRREQKKATFKQARVLRRFGYSADATFDEAKKLIDALAANRWRRPEPAVEAAAI